MNNTQDYNYQPGFVYIEPEDEYKDHLLHAYNITEIPTNKLAERQAKKDIAEDEEDVQHEYQHVQHQH